MPRPKATIPAYRLHKSTGQAVVYYDGQAIYLGVYNTPLSRQRYGELLQRVAAGLPAKPEKPGTVKPAKPGLVPLSTSGRTVAELLLQFVNNELPRYAEDEQRCQRGAITIVKDLFWDTLAADFGPLKLRIVRQAMIEKGWSRSYINRQVKRLRHIFRWAVGWEFIPRSVADALSDVESLRAGETDAPESKPRQSVSPERIAAVRNVLCEHHRDIFDLLLLTGARPGEIIGLTTGQLDRAGEVWRVDLSEHKTKHHGKSRTLFFNATAQAILQKYLKADPLKPLFSLSRNTFAAAVKEACEKAFSMPKELRRPNRNSLTAAQLAEVRQRARAWRKEHCYSPHWLRHTVATRLADELGVEHAQRLLGHANAAMTEHYSRKAERVAIEAANLLGDIA